MAVTVFRSNIASVGEGVVAELGDLEIESSKVWLGGAHTFTFRLTGQWVDSAFEEWLGNHLEDAYGAVRWRGWIAQIDRVMGWCRERVSLIDSDKPVYNAVRVAYDSGTTAWALNDDSIGRYGRIEKTLSLGHLGSANALVKRDNALSDHATPKPFFVAKNARYVDEPYVEITAIGYQTTMAFQESTAVIPDGTEISAALKLLVNADCPHLTNGWIFSTGVTVNSSEVVGTTAWARLNSLMDLLPNYWRCWIWERRVHLVDTRVNHRRVYRVNKDSVRNERGERVLDPWEVRPALMQFEFGPKVTTVLVKQTKWSTGDVIPEFGDVGSSDSVYYGALNE